MKKMMVLFITIAVVLSLAGCNTNRLDDASKLSTTPSTQNAYFIGKIIEVYEGGYLLTVTNTGNHYFAIGEKVAVDIDNENWSEFSVGNYIRVEFDKGRPTGNPPLIESKYVYSIEQADENGNIVE
jgi:hypothetical protein